MKQQKKEKIVPEVQEQISQEESQEYSSQDEDAVLLTQKVQEKLLQTVARIKSKDPSIYKVVNPIFDDDDFEEEVNHKTNSKKDKKFTYKDLLKEGGKQSQEDDEDEQLPPAMEQKKAKNKFKQALLKQKNIMNNEDEEDELFTVKGKIKKEKNKNQKTVSTQFDEFTKRMKPQTKKLIQSVWDNSQQMDETDVFLRDYIVSKKWLSKHMNGPKTKEQFQKVDEQDEQRSVQMDEHEARYNFRFQEPDGDKIVQYPRKIEDSMRTKSESRKEKRKRVEERKKDEEKEFRQQAEKKKEQLRNDILAKLNEKEQQDYDQNQQMQEEEDFQHDWFFCDDCGRAFEEEETNYQCGECEDYMLCQDCYELIIHRHPLVRSEVPAGFGAPKESVTSKILEKLYPCKTCRRKIPSTVKHYSFEDKSKNVQLLCERCFDQSPLDIKKKFTFIEAKLNSSNIEAMLDKDPLKIKQLTNSKQIEDMVDQYLKYEFQDVIGGGIKTKFKYLTVKPESYGLSDEQILFGDDKQLNNYISIKKLAPYRDDRMKLRNNIYKKKVTTIDKSVTYNKKLIEKDLIERKIKKSRIIDKLKRRSEVMKNKRENKLKILNISNPIKEKQLFVPNSRLASYGVTLQNTHQTNQRR